MLTKEHCEALVELLRDKKYQCIDPKSFDAWRFAVQVLGEVLKKDNPEFDLPLFKHACLK